MGNKNEREDGVEELGGATPVKNPAGAAFFGSPDGSNNETQNRPEVKAPTKPTL